MQLATTIGTLIGGLPTATLATRLDELSWRIGYNGARNLATLPACW